MSGPDKETLELRKEKNAGRQEEGERGREHREAGRGKGEQRAVEGGTERQRVLGETAREPLHEKAEAQQQESAASGSAEQHFLERCCARRFEDPMAAGGAARLCLAAHVAPGGTLGASAEGGRARGPAGSLWAAMQAGRRSCSALGPPHALAASAVELGVRA